MRTWFFLGLIIGAVWAQCNGCCQNTQTDSCPSGYKSGLCPGASNIECCEEVTSSCPGQCQDQSLSCAGTYKSGLCPGSASVLCCAGVQPFADRQWDCADVDCTTIVASGASQPNYECAEFVARSLAAGGYIPNLGALAAQSAYGSYGYNGVTYDLLWVSSKQGGPAGLREALVAMGWVTGSIVSKSAVFVDGSDGPYSHVAIGVGSNLCDAHNNARYHISSCNTYYTVNEIRNPPAWWGMNDTAKEGAGPLPGLHNDDRPRVIPPSN